MKKLIGLLSILSLSLTMAVPAFGAEETVLIQKESDWQYRTVDTEAFYEMDPLWMTPDFSSDWETGTAPFGDRIQHENAEEYGWIGSTHGIFLRKTFTVDDPSALKGLHFYLDTFYDNTVHIYLNGEEIFSDDALGGSGDWTDEFKLFELADLSNLLVPGENLLAVSVLDNNGGRELELSLFASSEELETSSIPGPYTPPEENPDKPDPPKEEPKEEETEPPKVTDAPVNDELSYGSALPFTRATEQTSPPIVTVYVTADNSTAGQSTANSVAPFAMVGASLLLSTGMVIAAWLISRRGKKDGDVQ